MQTTFLPVLVLAFVLPANAAGKEGRAAGA
jgi:hypothetical protein